MTGTVSMSYQKSMTGTAGLALSDNSFIFADTEDLGSGMKLVMSTGFDAGGRTQTGGGAFGSENTSLAVSGGFGAVKLFSVESDGPFAAIAALGGASLAQGVFDTNAVGLGKRFRNGVSYVAPSMNGFTPALTYVTLAGQYASNAYGSDATAPVAPAVSAYLSSNNKIVPAVTYLNGPLKVYFEDAFFNADYPGTTTTSGGAVANGGVSQPTIYATYDFGAAKVGAAWTKASNGDATYAMGVNVPVGAVTLGLATYTWKNSSSTVYGDATWTEGSIDYALSKRTSLKVSMAQTNDAGVSYAGGATSTLQSYGLTTGLVQNCEYRVGLYHSF